MKELLFLIGGFALLSILIPQTVDAGMYGEVYIPDHEFIGFYDETDTYTVFAGIKNKEYYPIIPTVTITVQDGDAKIVEEYELSTIMPDNMLPMKVQIPEVKSANPILEEPLISYKKSEKSFPGGYIIYDETLIIHDDGNLTGKIRNGGDNVFEKFRIYALIKDKNDIIIDVASSEIFEQMNPGDVFDFKLMVSPHIADKVDYYSCFAFGDDSIMPLTAKKGDEEFTFRYTANAWFKDGEFNADETELSLYSFNGFQIPVTGSFEFPSNSIHENYEVVLDGEKFGDDASSKDAKIQIVKKVETLQSIDEMGNWHLYFEVPQGFQGNVEISGFMENDGTIVVPDEIELTELISYEITGGEVEQILAKPNDASLLIMIDAETDGEIMLKMNEFLIRPFENDEYIALNHIRSGASDGSIETLQLTDTFSYDTGKTITIPFSAGTDKIEIFGSYVVPEFGHVVMGVLIIGIIATMILAKKTNSITNLFYTKL
jgi:predicted secreted protein with PEFG-CTERM motif